MIEEALRAISLFLGVTLLLSGAPWWLAVALRLLRGPAVVPLHVIASSAAVGAGSALLGVCLWVS